MIWRSIQLAALGLCLAISTVATQASEIDQQLLSDFADHYNDNHADFDCFSSGTSSPRFEEVTARARGNFIQMELNFEEARDVVDILFFSALGTASFGMEQCDKGISWNVTYYCTKCLVTYDPTDAEAVEQATNALEDPDQRAAIEVEYVFAFSNRDDAAAALELMEQMVTIVTGPAVDL